MTGADYENQRNAQQRVERLLELILAELKKLVELRDRP